ncbi:iron ABC transporter permease [Pseudomonas sp. ABC1]|uniref:FecCD family ABC transporter permease n=1 Tax=Pseudomonas sp. ABC1 TaxID=2748080 RepID=UPI0015C30A8D|nr:iron ABC transporter permease [Pseudomonas sp. ABC1]QLF94068.1 iron ABC transporter permease [Pseudomonas sp. ABC1]
MAQTMGRWRAVGLVPWLALLIVLIPLSVCIGTRWIAPGVAWEALVAFDPGNDEHLLVRHLRLPRTLLALLVGCALGVAGVVMQALTRNPLADPGLLGVNAGAALGVVVAVAFFGVLDVAGHLFFGMSGAALAGVAVYLLGGLRQSIDPVRVVLAGAALSVVLLALTQIITLNSDEAVFDQFRHWAVGSLQGRGHAVLVPVSLLVVAGLLLALGLARVLDTLALGDDLGKALGANPPLVWALAALVIVGLAGTATAAAGPISFVGLTAPHLARFLCGANHRRVLPCAMLLSATLLLLADCLGRVVAPPGEVGVGIMVALLGGPFFVVLVRRRRIVQL